MRTLPLLLFGGCSILNQPDADLIPTPPPPPVEICDNGEDDDSDGLRDCADPNCFEAEVCVLGERTPTACQDGRDNDADRAQDCEDSDCWEHRRCFSFRPLDPVPSCNARAQIEDAFDSDGPIDTSIWSVFSTSATDAPAIVGGALDIDGRDNLYESSIVSRARFSTGAAAPFTLHAEIRADPGCGALPGPRTCITALAVHTRADWSDGLAGGGAILTIRSIAQPSGLFEVACYYHDRSAGSAMTSLGLWHDLDAGVDEDTGQLIARLDGTEICRGDGPMTPHEPEANLVITGRNTAAGERVAVRNVTLTVDPVEPSATCLVPAAEVLPVGACGSSYYAGGTRLPSILRGPSADHLLFQSRSTFGQSLAAAYARSETGPFGWSVPSASEAAIPDDDRRPLALAYDPARALLLAWVAANTATELWSAPEVAPSSTWTRVSSEVSADGLPFTLLGSVVIRDGTYQAWYQRPDGIATAFSSDGIAFTSMPDPVLVPDPSPAWDSDGIGFPSVHDDGEGYVMAYSATPFPNAPSVGLAFSEDGLTFEKHRDNPVVEPQRPGFDDVGLTHPSIHFQDRSILQIYYETQSTNLIPCPGFAELTFRIGLAELRFADP